MEKNALGFYPSGYTDWSYITSFGELEKAIDTAAELIFNDLNHNDKKNGMAMMWYTKPHISRVIEVYTNDLRKQSEKWLGLASPIYYNPKYPSGLEIINRVYKLARVDQSSSSFSLVNGSLAVTDTKEQDNSKITTSFVKRVLDQLYYSTIDGRIKTPDPLYAFKGGTFHPDITTYAFHIIPAMALVIGTAFAIKKLRS